jgi:methionine-gamma-lyase
MRRDVSGLQFSTRAIHGGEAPDPVTGAHNPPLYQTTTFAFSSLADKQAAIEDEGREGFVYTRGGNPTTRMFERKMALLEGAEDSVLAASGMGAIAATLLALLGNGGHLVASRTIYPIAEQFVADDLPALGIDTTFVDVTDHEAIARAIRPETRVLYVETLANPTLDVADIPALAALAHERGVMLVVDNTFASPWLLRPLALGADLVIHSATKYLSGHGDVIAGVVSGSEELTQRIRRMVSHVGSPISPFNAWLLLRGVKTLELRMERHCQNAMRLAEFLAARPEVERVRYPGLPGHPGHEVAARMLGGRFGGMLSFEMVGGPDAGQQFADALQLCFHAVSLGDVSTLVWAWSDRNLVRVSVGLEAADDLIADFTQAFAAVNPDALRSGDRG